MLLKTHLMIALFVVILFFQHVNNKITFIIMVMVATVIPDLDTNLSSWGRHSVFRPIQFFVKHRGVFHSITFALVVSFIISVFYPILSLGFFMGYALHIFCDSFTKEGVQPFWPIKAKSKGVLRSGGKVEETLFLVMILVNVAMFFLVIIF